MRSSICLSKYGFKLPQYQFFQDHGKAFIVFMLFHLFTAGTIIATTVKRSRILQTFNILLDIASSGIIREKGKKKAI